MIRQTADIVMGLDDCTLANAGFYNIRINGSLGKEIHFADLLCFFFKDIDELSADDLSLLLRVRNTLELFIEVILGIDSDKVELIGTIGAKDCFDFIAFIFAQQAVVHKDTGQLLAYCL